MERIPGHLQKNFYPLKLYLDDLKDIIEIIEYEISQMNVFIGNYRIHDIDDVHSLREEYFNKVYIHKNSYCTLDFNNKYASLTIYGDTNLYRGLYGRLLNKIKKRQRRFLYVLSKEFDFYTSIILILFSFIALVIFNIWVFLVLALTILCAYIILGTTYYYFSEFYTLLILHPKKNAQGFLKRNKDNILLEIIKAIIFIIIGHFSPDILNFFSSFL